MTKHKLEGEEKENRKQKIKVGTVIGKLWNRVPLVVVDKIHKSRLNIWNWDKDDWDKYVLKLREKKIQVWDNLGKFIRRQVKKWNK